MNYKVNIKELKVEMARKGLNGEKLAKACKIHPATVSRLLNGSAPTYLLMCKIVCVLELSSERAVEIFFMPILHIA